VGRWTYGERAVATQPAMNLLRWGRVARQSAFSPETVEGVLRRALGLRYEGRPLRNSGWANVAAMATTYLEGTPDRAPHVIWANRVIPGIICHLDATLPERGLNPRTVFPRWARYREAVALDIVRSNCGTQAGFNRSSQHSRVAGILAALRGLRWGFAS
jgi:hypothetical protein